MERKPNGYWTFDRCQEEALKYFKKYLFKTNSSGAYSSAKKYEWLNEICSHMNEIQKPKGYWNKDKCHEEALKYNTKIEFRYKNGGAYDYALRNKFLNDICNHMIELRKPKGYWNKEKCHEEALKYKIRQDFQKKSGGAYDYAYINNWLDEICSHMKTQGSRYKRCIYVYEFSDNCAYIGLTYNLKQRNSNRLKDKKDQVTKHIIKTGLEPIFKELTEYIDKDEASKLEGVYKQQYIDNGWKILNIAKTGGLGGSIRKWTYEKCQEEALKYNTKTEFVKNNGSAYNSAIINGWLDNICSHMVYIHKPKGYWTKDLCHIEALKYKTKSDFIKNNNGAYLYANRNKFLNEICSHMILQHKPNGYWSYDLCKIEALKYESRRKMQINSGGAYNAAKNNKWLDEICTHMIKNKKGVK